MSDEAAALTIRPLDPRSDRELAARVLRRCDDYVRLETGRPPDDDYLTEFFEDVPPGRRVEDVLKLGVFEGSRIVGLLDIYRGYPQPDDWYIGLMLFVDTARNKGLGRRALDWIVEAARAERARRLLLCVLEHNPRARAFWQRHGFTVLRTVPPSGSAAKAHIRIEMQKPLLED